MAQMLWPAEALHRPVILRTKFQREDQSAH